MSYPVFEAGKVSVPFTCPDCDGPLWESKFGTLRRFECRVGHAFSSDSMLAGQTDQTERALWTAAKELEQSAALMRHLAGYAVSFEMEGSDLDLERLAKEKEEHARVIRKLLKSEQSLI